MLRKAMRIAKVFSLLSGIAFHFSTASAQTDSTEFIKGADVSFIPQIENLGGVYKDNRTPQDPLKIFKDHGFNFIRLKIWHTPRENYNNLEKILYMARRIKENDLKLLLDFHYSDTWADPGRQSKPAAWAGLSFDVLKDSVYQYTKNVMRALCDQQTLPDMVQIGNEITPGMLWNDGRVGGSFDTPPQWKNLGELVKAGARGVRESCDAGDSVRIMIHLDRGADNAACRWYFNNLISQGVEFDVIGLSYYPWWHGTLNAVRSNLDDLAARFGKDLIIAETAYPWTLQWFDNTNNIVGSANQLHSGYPATVTGQADFLRELMKIVRNVKNQKGQGIFYWAPEYISVQPLGSSWENNTLFDFNGNALSSMNVFLEVVSGVDDADQDIPSSFQLNQNYPNPFNGETRISYVINKATFVKLMVYDIQGSVIGTLVQEAQPAGDYSVTWNAQQKDGAFVATGLYFIRLETGNGVETRKALLLK
jgi:arabinogalactan endo-1,4-beta-galactosidase